MGQETRENNTVFWSPPPDRADCSEIITSRRYEMFATNICPEPHGASLTEEGTMRLTSSPASSDQSIPRRMRTRRGYVPILVPDPRMQNRDSALVLLESALIFLNMHEKGD